jgi:hypothetical protein
MNFTDSEVTEHLQGSSKGYIISRPVLFSNNKMLFCVLVPIRLFLVAHLGDRYIKENKKELDCCRLEATHEKKQKNNRQLLSR